MNRLFRSRSPRFQPALLLLAATLAPSHAVAIGPVLSVTPTVVSFNYANGGVVPPTQTVSITSVPTGAAITVSGGASWVVPSLSFPATPSILSLRLQPVNLAEGLYSTTFTVSAPSATPVTITVNLTVIGNPPPTAPNQLSFFYTTGGTFPPPQAFSVAYTGVAFSVSVSQPWLLATINTGVTPAQVIVSVNPTGLAPGIYTGTVSVSFATNPPAFQSVSVTLSVDSGGSFWTTSGPMSFAARAGGPAPPAQTLTVSYATMIFFTAEAQSSGWLKLDSTTGITPSNIGVMVDQTGLGPGTYTGTIVLSSTSAIAPTSVTVTLVVTGDPGLTITPTSLVFEAAAGGSPPPSKTALVNTLLPASYKAEVANATWLSVTPLTGLTPQTLTVTADPAGLGPGVYRGTIVISLPGTGANGQLLTVTLTVTGSVTLSASPTSLQFSAPVGGTAPAQNISVTSSNPANVNVSSSVSWLVVSPASGATPLNVGVSVQTTGLTAGQYSGTVTIAAPGAAQSLSIPVTLNIGGSTPSIREVSNGAGLLREFAGGSTLTVFGRDLGPPMPVGAMPGPDRKLPTELAGVQLFAGGLAAPLLSVSATQVMAMVPFELIGRSSIEIRVVYQGRSSETVTAPFFESAPVQFTADGSGRGLGAIVNENGTVNSQTSRAPLNSVVQMYGAGGGQFEPELLTGSIVQGTGRLRLPVAVFFGGLQAEVLYAGPAPGMAAGIFQINARIPAEVLAGSNAAVTLRIGSGFSQSGVTVAVE